MDRDKIKNLRKALESHDFSEIEEQFGVRISFGNASYMNCNATMKMEIAEIGADGEVRSKEAEYFKSMALVYGLKPEDLGREFRLNGQTFKIIGANSKAQKMPILAANDKGKTYKFGTETVKAMLVIA